jgi:hypothetical protein
LHPEATDVRDSRSKRLVAIFEDEFRVFGVTTSGVFATGMVSHFTSGPVA